MKSKRVLALFLSSLVLFSSLPISTFAKTEVIRDKNGGTLIIKVDCSLNKPTGNGCHDGFKPVDNPKKELPVRGIRFLNNNIKEFDYKLTDEEMDKLKSKLPLKEPIVEQFRTNTGRLVKGEKDYISYLLDNNIITRDSGINMIVPGGNRLEEIKKVSKPTDPSAKRTNGEYDKEVCTKSEFVMGLYKSTFGPIMSRPLVFDMPANRFIGGEEKHVDKLSAEAYKPAGFEVDKLEPVLETTEHVHHQAGCLSSSSSSMGACTKSGCHYERTTNEYKLKPNDVIFNFQKDYGVYVSPDVYELYFSDLLNKGLLRKEDFSNDTFLKEYSNNGKTLSSLNVTDTNVTAKEHVEYARWNNDISPYYGTQASPAVKENVSKGSPLGQGFFIKSFDLDKHKSMPNFFAYKVDVKYFKEERIRTIDALRLVETFLRREEKDLSDRESEILAYKYGTPYLNILDKDSKKTITYLVAMGVLDFEDKQDFSNLYDILTKEKAYKLFYKVKNPSARKDFSKIQITDSDNFWIQKGYTESEIDLVTQEKTVLPWTEKVLEFNENETDKNTSLATFKNFISPLANLFCETVYAVDMKKPEEAEKDISKNEKENVWKVVKGFSKDPVGKFKGKPIASLKEGDFEKLVVSNKVDGNKRVIEFKVKAPTKAAAVAYVDSNFDVQEAFKSKETVRTVTRISTDGEDKVVDTYIAGDEFKRGFSEIEVIEDKVLKNKKTGDMAVLLQDNKTALIGNTVLKFNDKAVINMNNVVYYNLDVIKGLMTETYLSSIDPATLYTSSVISNEKIVKVYGSNDINIENVPVARFKDLKDDKGKTVTKDMFNVNLLTRGVTSLMRDFRVNSEGKEVNFRLIVDWAYVMPESTSMLSTLAEKKGDFTVDEASETLFKRPSDPTLQKWWDNNVGMSNALINLIMDTSSVEYIRSGYLAPSIKLLCSAEDYSRRDAENFIFGNIEFSSAYVKEFLGGHVKGFLDKGFNHKFTNGDDVHKQLMASRRYEFFKGKPYTSDPNTIDFNSRYVMTPSANVYKDVNEDERLIYTDGIIRVKTRNQGTAKNEVDQRKVMLNGKEFYANGYGISSKEGKYNGYYKLVSTKPVLGKIKKVGNGYTVGDESRDFVREECNSIYEKLSNDAYIKTDLIVDLAGELPLSEMQPGFTLVGNKFYDYQSFLGRMPKKTEMDSSKVFGDVLAYPTVYVSRTAYSLNEDGSELIPVKTMPYVAQGNIFYCGINQAMIDKIIADSVSTVSLEKIPVGSDVLIGDIKFKYNQGKLISYPIGNVALMNDLNANLGDIKTPVVKMFSGMNLDYSGRSMSFTKYIKNAEIARMPKTIKGEKTLTVQDGVYYVKDGDKWTPYGGGNIATSACISLELDNNLEFRQIGQSNKYTLMMCTDKYSDGYLNKLPFFSERLSISMKDDLYLKLQTATFKPILKFNQLKEEYFNLYKDILKADVKTVLRALLAAVLSYLIVISWIGFTMIRCNVGRTFLEDFRAPHLDKPGARNVDLLKFFTLGMFNLDDDINPSKLFIANLVMFTLLYLVIDVL